MQSEMTYSERIAGQQEVRPEEEHRRTMERRPQVDEAEIAFPKTV
jgi:hypothetical protein